MITNASVLQEGFVPNDSIHRNREVNALSRSLDPLTRGRATDPVLLTGPSGVGKTTFARFAVDQLQATVPEVRAVHVNCWESHTRRAALFDALESLQLATDLHRTSTSHDELLDRLADVDAPVVLILDEVDQLDDASVVYDCYATAGVTTILITNDEGELLHGMDSRVRSRLQTADHIHFDAYTSRQLADILQARVDHGLVADAISEAQLLEISDAAAGDARVALSILRTAAQTAAYEERATITDGDIDDAIPRGNRLCAPRHSTRSENHNGSCSATSRRQARSPPASCTRSSPPHAQTRPPSGPSGRGSRNSPTTTSSSDRGTARRERTRQCRKRRTFRHRDTL
ncbi:Cdc6/Cdc18 family protein [Halobaculum sp. MBLA0147]|uniref:Cdc6/Cdc18 family protein n=1 Tax=Halobaculum sp. MBLA0147 TaxID=3079934 RepID=UPI0035236869